MARTRYRLQDSLTSIFPSGTSTAKRFLDALEDPASPSYQYTITDEAITIPASGADTLRIELDHVPDGDPTNTSVLRVNTQQSAAGTDFTGTTSTDDLTTYQVRVHPGRPFLDFNRASLASAGVTTVYATYVTYTSVFTASWGNRVELLLDELTTWAYNHISAGETGTITEERYKIGEVGGCLGDRLVYPANSGGETKWFYADASDRTKLPLGYLATDTAEGAAATVIICGVVTTFADNPQPGMPLWASPVAGRYTWESDTGGNVLTTGDYVCNFGQALPGGTTGYVNFINPPVYKKEAA